MNDQLEKFVAANRDAFDDATPPATILAAIQKKTGNRKAPRQLFIIKAAAAVFAVLCVTAFFVFRGKTKDIPPAETVAEYDESTYGDPVYAKQIYHFRELIGLKQSELKQLEKEYPQLYKEFVGDIRQLDSAYQSLKVDLADNPNRELLLEAMLRNLQLQSELLNRQLMIIKEIKQKLKTTSHEKNTI